VIGPRAEIVHSYVGPYTSIGADVVVEGSEIEYSVVLDGAEIRFVGERLEESVVGRRARIGREHRLPRALRLMVSDGAEVTLA
jgi:glucose-1-phosphate thymidylyltransferase